VWVSVMWQRVEAVGVCVCGGGCVCVWWVLRRWVCVCVAVGVCVCGGC
jgi:hypothetical protein